MLQTAHTPRPFLFLRSSEIGLLKATLKKMVMVPGYIRSDGRAVAAHQKMVHYNPDVLFADVAAGKGSHSQKKAHAKLSNKAWWQNLSVEDQAIAIMALATDIQDAASNSAAVSGWKASASAGKNPTKKEWAAFYALPKDKQAALHDHVQGAAGGLAHLQAPSLPVPPEKATAIEQDAAPAETPPAGHISFPGGNNTSYHVNAISGGKFSVSVKDDDSGETLPTMTIFPTLEGAIASAKALSEKSKALTPNPVPVVSPAMSQVMEGADHAFEKKNAEDLADFAQEAASSSAPGAKHALAHVQALQAKLASANPPAAAQPLPDAPTPSDLGEFAGIDASLQAHSKLKAMESGPHYQKVALAKLQGDAAWQALGPVEQHAQAMALYKELQGAASQAAAVSVAKKAMLAGKVPSKAQYAALMAAGLDVQAKVAAEVGTDKYHDLMMAAQAAVEGKPGNTAAAAPVPPVSLVEQAKRAMLAGNPPSKEQYIALVDAGSKVLDEVTDAVGAAQYLELMAQAAAAAGNDGKAAVKKLVDKQLADIAKQKSPSDLGSAYKYLVAADDAGGAEAVKKAAIEWAAQNPDSKQLAQALHDVGYSHLMPPKDGDTKKGADGTLVFKDGRWHKVVAADEHGEVPPALVPVDPPAAPPKIPLVVQPKGGIDFEAEKLPASNSNAPSHNKAVLKIQSLALAGDKTGLQAFIDGKADAKQTYAKKQLKLAQAVLASIANPAPPAAVSAPAAPSAPKPAPAAPKASDAQPFGMFGGLKADVDKAFEAGNNSDLYDIVKYLNTPQNAKTPGAKELLAYAKAKMGAAKPPAPTPGAVAAVGQMSLAELKAIVDAPGIPKASNDLIKKKIAELEAASQPAAPEKVSVQAALYGNTTNGHNKQWSVSVHGKDVKVEWGKIGAKQQSLTKHFDSEVAAKAHATELKTSKLKGGYHFDGYTTHHHGESSGKPPIPVVVKPAAPAAPEAAPSWGYEHDSDGYGLNLISGKVGGEGVTVAWAPTDGEYQVKLGTEPFELFESADAAVSYLNQQLGDGQPITDGVLQALQDGNDPTATLNASSDGKTKQGVAGLLVLKDGHWVLANPDDGFKLATKGKTQKSIKEAVASFGVTSKVKTKAIKAAASGDITEFLAMLNVASDSPNLKKTTEVLKAIAKMAGLSFDGEAAAPAASPNFEQAWPIPKPSGAPTAGHKAVSVGGTKVQSMDDWKQTGEQAGSNPGGQFTDKAGGKWYVKFPKTDAHAKNELLAAKFYEMLGVAGPSLKLVSKDGKIGVASKWVEGTKQAAPEKLKALDGALSNFAIDAWLANWDVVGTGYDNLKVGPDGKAIRIDAGGSLLYRAQGEPKGAAFGDEVAELGSLVDPGKNSYSAAVFSGITKDQMLPGLKQLAKLKPSQIETLVDKIGPGSDAEKAALAKKLIARRTHILAHYGIEDRWNKPPPNEAKLIVDKSKLPKPIDFNNIDGKPLSSKKHVNDQNSKDSAALVSFASRGNLKALKDYKYDAVDKETGKDLGKKPIADHPSAKIKHQWAELVTHLQAIAYPPSDTLPMPSFGLGGGSASEVADAVGFYSPADRVETISSENRMGFFMKLASVDSVDDAMAESKWRFLSASDPFIHSAKAAYQGYSSLTKGYISGVQASGSINHVWSQGKAGHVHGLAATKEKIAAQLYHDATELPDGTTLWRWMDDSAGTTMKGLLDAKPGDTFQNTDSMCSSYKKSWGNNSHFGSHIRLKIRCAKGSKAIISYGSGGYSSEGEFTTLPGARFLVVSTKKGIPGNANGVDVECIMLPPDEGYVAELGKLAQITKAATIASPWQKNLSSSAKSIRPSPRPLLIIRSGERMSLADWWPASVRAPKVSPPLSCPAS